MSMSDILKKLNNIENKKPLTESVVTECPADMGPQQSNVNISITGNSMADIMRALAGIESSAPRGELLASPMDNPNIPGQDDIAGDDDMQDGVIGTAAGGAIGALAGGPIGAGIGAVAGDKLTGEEEVEEWDNEPDEDYRDHNFMTKDLSGGINRQKKMYKPAAKGDNPMAVESIKNRLLKALSEKKAKPDYLDMDKDGNKKEPMKKAIADKKKNPFAKTNEAKKAKPDYLDMDKDGNKKEPMKKAIADKKKGDVKEAQVDEISVDKMQNYHRAAKQNRAGNDAVIMGRYPGSDKKAHADNAKRKKGLDMARKKIHNKVMNKEAVETKKKVSENLTEGMRLVSKAEKGNRAVKIYKDADWGEFVVKHFENGQYMQDADYFDSDKQAAVDTAKHFLSGAQESVANEADRSGSHDKFLVYMQKGAINSQGDKKYYIIDYVVKPGFVHHPLALQKVFNEHPITQRLRKEGYVGPEMVSNIPDNIDAEIEKTKERIAQTEPHKSGFPVPYYDAVKRLKQLEQTKQLLNSVPLVKEADITELSPDIKSRYAKKAQTSLNRASNYKAKAQAAADKQSSKLDRIYSGDRTAGSGHNAYNKLDKASGRIAKHDKTIAKRKAGLARVNPK